MTIIEVLGTVGIFLIGIAWLIETIRIVKQHKRLTDLGFALVYFTGTLLLFVYAFIIGNQIFAALEFAVLLLVAFEIAYTVVKLCLCRYADIHVNCGCKKCKKRNKIKRGKTR